MRDLLKLGPLSTWLRQPYKKYSIICLMRIMHSKVEAPFGLCYGRHLAPPFPNLACDPREALPRHRAADRDHGGVAHARQRLSLGFAADLPDHRALYARGGL